MAFELPPRTSSAFFGFSKITLFVSSLVFKVTLLSFILRSNVLNFLVEKESTIVVSYSEAVIQKVVNKKTYLNQTLRLKKNEIIDYDSLIEKLEKIGFEMIDFISQPGQFSVRGSIIDIFSHNNKNPIRLEIYNEILVEIREFEIHTQLSQKRLDFVNINSSSNDNIKIVRLLVEAGADINEIYKTDDHKLNIRDFSYRANSNIYKILDTNDPIIEGKRLVGVVEQLNKIHKWRRFELINK